MTAFKKEAWKTDSRVVDCIISQTIQNLFKLFFKLSVPRGERDKLFVASNRLFKFRADRASRRLPRTIVPGIHLVGLAALC